MPTAVAWTSQRPSSAASIAAAATPASPTSATLVKGEAASSTATSVPNDPGSRRGNGVSRTTASGEHHHRPTAADTCSDIRPAVGSTTDEPHGGEGHPTRRNRGEPSRVSHDRKVDLAPRTIPARLVPSFQQVRKALQGAAIDQARRSYAYVVGLRL